jgi:hypothetical protein
VPEGKQVPFGVRVLAGVRWISGSAASHRFAFEECVGAHLHVILRTMEISYL